MNYNSDYDIRLKTLESLGGDVTKKYDSVYSIDLEILRLLEQGGGGGGVVIQNYKGLITNPNTELIKAGDLGYNEVSVHNVKYSKYFTFVENFRTLYLKKPDGTSKNFLKVQKSGDFYNLCVNKLNEDGTYTWEVVQENLQGLPELTKIPFTYIFYDETLSKNIEFPGEYAWSLDRQEIYYTSTIDGWVPELKMKGATEWNEGFYDISEPEVFTKKQKSFYVKDGDGNVINTNDINKNSETNSSKVVKISKDWYNNQDNYQTEIKKALEDIYNEVSNNRSVTVVYDGFGDQSPDWIFEASNVQLVDRNYIIIYGFGWAEQLMTLVLRYYEESNHSSIELFYKTLAVKSSLWIPYIYQDWKLEYDIYFGNISELISVPIVDNEQFVVVKTTVPAYTGTDTPHHQIYYALNDNGNRYLLSKFGGIKLLNDENNVNLDLLPDGEWYVVYNEMQSTTYTKIIITKAVRNVDGSLDVYLGFKGYDVDSLEFWDCTVDNRDTQMQVGGGKWSDKNWVKVSDAQNISVDSFMARRTMYFTKNTEGVKTDKITLFKRMK